MLKVNVKSGNIDKALKMLKNKVRGTKQVIALRNNKNYTKPSEERRDKKRKAIYVDNKRREKDNG